MSTILDGIKTFGKSVIGIVLIVGMGVGFYACQSQRFPRASDNTLRGEPVPPPFAYPYIPTLEDAQRLVQNYPKSAVAQYELARVYHAQKEYEKAIPAFEKSLELDPLILHAYAGLADCYKYKASPDWQRAEKLLLKLRSLAYGSRYRYLAWYELGNFYLDRHTALKNNEDLSKAERAYQQALKEAPNSQCSSCAHGIGIVHARKQEWEPAISWFKKAVEWADEPRPRARALEALANAHAEIGDIQTANRLIEEAKIADPSYQARVWVRKRSGMSGAQ